MKVKKIISVILCFSLLSSLLALTALAAAETDYTIVNPYETVNWDEWETYKANLHTHTTASDGDIPLSEMVEIYYDLGYDILAITDHGVVSEGWMAERTVYPLFNEFRTVVPMTQQQYDRITTGSDRGGRGMTDITGGIECNMAVMSKTHVNGYFTTYGSGVMGNENDYKTATVEIDKTGGYSVLNHVGDWVNSNNFPERSGWDSYIAYFADIFETTDSCLGMEIINGTDNFTRADRVLWDNLLEVVIPTGRNIWAFSDDDSEELGDIGRSFELFVLPENTEEAVKTGMINGTFFASSIYDKSTGSEEFIGNGDVPVVKSIAVDQNENTISVTPDATKSCTKIEWVANGKVISNDYTIDLNDYEEDLGCYVRFKLYGEGGVTYSQAFELDYEKRVDTPVPEQFDSNPIGGFIKALFQSIPFALLALIIEKIEAFLGII